MISDHQEIINPFQSQHRTLNIVKSDMSNSKPGFRNIYIEANVKSLADLIIIIYFFNMKITTAIVTVFTVFASFASAQQNSDSSSIDTYDYVIVGGGVAGKLH